MSEPTASAEARPGRVLALDGIRGLAALSVVVYHLQSLRFMAGDFMKPAHLAVDLFFVLSGFVIGQRFEAEIVEGRLAFAGFVRRRLARLYPAYAVSLIWVFVLAMLGVRVLGGGRVFDGSPVEGAAMQALLLHNLGLHDVQWNFPTWSVSVEWVVNLLFFPILALAPRRAVPSIMAAMLACSVALVVGSPHELALDAWKSNIGPLNAGLARGVIGFGLGFLLHRARPRLSSISRHALHVMEVGVVVLTIAAVALHLAARPAGVDWVLVIICFPSLVGVCSRDDGWLARLLGSRVPVFLGTISYSLYVLHVPLLSSVARTYRRTPPPLDVVLCCSLLIVLAAASHQWVEKPGAAVVQRLGSRRPPR